MNTSLFDSVVVVGSILNEGGAFALNADGSLSLFGQMFSISPEDGGNTTLIGGTDMQIVDGNYFYGNGWSLNIDGGASFANQQLTIDGDGWINGGTSVINLTDGFIGLSNDAIDLNADGSANFAFFATNIEADGGIAVNNGAIALNADGSIIFANGQGTLTSSGGVSVASVIANTILYGNSTTMTDAYGNFYGGATVTNTNNNLPSFNTSGYNQTVYDTTSSAHSTATLSLPSATSVGQILRYTSKGGVTTLTVLGGIIVAGSNPTTLAANATVAWQAVNTSGSYIRIQ